MCRLFHTPRKACLALLVLGVLGGIAAPAQAAGIAFRNDLNVRVMVQGASSVNNVARRGPLLVIDPGKTLWDSNVPTGNREIIVYSGQPTRILCRTVVPFMGQNITMSINVDRMGRMQITEKKSP
jgi:hypothetical protein